MAHQYLTLIKRRINQLQKTLQSSCVIWLSVSFNAANSAVRSRNSNRWVHTYKESWFYQSLNLLHQESFSSGPASLVLTASSAAWKCHTPKKTRSPQEPRCFYRFAQDKARSASLCSSVESFPRADDGLLGTGGICLQELCQPAAACSASAGLLIA